MDITSWHVDVVFFGSSCHYKTPMTWLETVCAHYNLVYFPVSVVCVVLMKVGDNIIVEFMVLRKVKYKRAWKMRIRSMIKLEDILKEVHCIWHVHESIGEIEVDEAVKVPELIQQM